MEKCMLSYQNDKKNKIQEIISIVKLCIVVFVGIILNNYFGNQYTNFDLNNYMLFMIIMISSIIIALIYYFWAFAFLKKKFLKTFAKKIEIIESLIFVSAFITIIMVTGANESNYKFIFIFIVITTTIQCGLKCGVLFSSIASFFILGIDVAYSMESAINLYFENDIVLVTIFYATAWILGYYVRIEKEYGDKLEELIKIDGLTELYNHKYFYDVLSKSFMQYKKEKIPLSLILMDIDYFKQYNDCLGHQTGDAVLRKIGEILKSLSTDKFTASRYGGDEFAIIATDMPMTNVIEFAEKVRTIIKKTCFEGEGQLSTQKLTVSIGISGCTRYVENDKELMKFADDALYQAKFKNKNHVELHPSAIDALKNDIKKKKGSLIPSFKTLICFINSKDKYTYGHIKRVIIYARLIAKELKLTQKDKKTLILGAYFHDIGKINISEQILVKKTPITDVEWGIIKQHPIDGERIIQSIEKFKDIIPIVLYHHEWYDGTGYPNQLKGNQIPYLARIISVIDSYDAMTSNRTYKVNLTINQAVEELKINSGSQFDPQIADAFIRVINNNYSLLQSMAIDKNYLIRVGNK